MGKKNGSYGRDYGKVVGGNNAKDFPGWKGPAFAKKADPRTTKKSTVVDEEPDLELESEVSIELQQSLLNVFRDTFPDLLDSQTLKPTLQEVKTALYERDFARAFGKEEYLEAYSVRWSPSRALCYTTILVGIREHLDALLAASDSKETVKTERSTLGVVSFGGGAAEVVAFGGFVKSLMGGTSENATTITSAALVQLSASEDRSSTSDTPENPVMVDACLPPARPLLDAILIDCAEWKSVVGKLHTGLLTPPIMSKYASTAAKEANRSLLVPSNLATEFRVADALGMDQNQIGDVVGTRPMLLTLLFTLNELYTSSIPKTTAFLLKLTISAKPGTLLLVVDSPGSYSETTMGSEAKKYPMLWLLNHTLIDSSKVNGVASKPDWEKVVSDDSRWFRIPERLRYPISLENMRYQIHLYRRL